MLRIRLGFYEGEPNEGPRVGFTLVIFVGGRPFLSEDAIRLLGEFNDGYSGKPWGDPFMWDLCGGTRARF